MANLVKKDPIRKKYFVPIEIAGRASSFLFYLAFIFTVLITILEKTPSGIWKSNLQIAYLVIVLIAFVLDALLIKLYLMPRANDARFKDFLSNSYTKIAKPETENYYNSNEYKSIRKIAAQLLENTLHSVNTLQVMCIRNRYKISFVILIWFVAMLNRNVELEWITIIAQAIFGEQLLSYHFRLEWTRKKYELIHEQIHELFTLQLTAQRFEMKTLELLYRYETAKATGGIIPTATIFDENNTNLSLVWDNMKANLNIK